MKATVYLSRKLLNQLKVKETESKDLMLTHNLHNIIINGKRVGCSGHMQNIIISIAAMTVSSASSMGKRVILMHSTTVHGFLPTQTLLQNSMENRFLSRNPTRNSTKPIFGPSLPLGLKQT